MVCVSVIVPEMPMQGQLKPSTYELEDDRGGALVRPQTSHQVVKASNHITISTTHGVGMVTMPDDSLKFTFFGKPVEGSLSHHTILGQPLSKFDFLVQPFVLVEAEWDEQTQTWTSVTLVQQGEPVTCCLTHIPFDTLSKRLKLWTSCQSGFRVCVSMCFGKYVKFWVRFGSTDFNVCHLFF